MVVLVPMCLLDLVLWLAMYVRCDGTHCGAVVDLNAARVCLCRASPISILQPHHRTPAKASTTFSPALRPSSTPPKLVAKPPADRTHLQLLLHAKQWRQLRLSTELPRIEACPMMVVAGCQECCCCTMNGTWRRSLQVQL